MAIDIRPAHPDELRSMADVMRVSLLHGKVDDAEWDEWKQGWEADHLAVGAFDDGRAVGHAGSFTFDTLVPGGRWLPTAGITRVGVLPTHIRRGLLTGMMRRLLDDERASGKALAALRASEAVIYSRFGFGLAGYGAGVELQPRRLVPVRGAAGGSMRILGHHEVRDVLAELFPRMMHRPGDHSRSAFIWKRVLEGAADLTKADFVAVHTSDDGVDDGFVHYSVRWESNDLDENLGEGRLHDLYGASPEVELALWQYLFNVSLLRTIRCDNRPLDDLVRLAVPDVRGYRVLQVWDQQWLRLLDVERCLTARTYEHGEPVTIAVTDPWYPQNEGTFRISAAGAERTDLPAELTAGINEISAAYMGSVHWRDLLAVGRVTGDSGAAARADRLFAVYPGSWSGLFF